MVTKGHLVWGWETADRMGKEGGARAPKKNRPFLKKEPKFLMNQQDLVVCYMVLSLSSNKML